MGEHPSPHAHTYTYTFTCTHSQTHTHIPTITSWELVSSLCAVGGQPSPGTLWTELAADTTSGRLTRLLPLWCHVCAGGVVCTCGCICVHV